MALMTGISWADSTCNCWIGCTKVSRACDHCYAERDWDKRKHRVTWGPHGDRSYCKAGWALLRKFQRDAEARGGVDPQLGRRRRVFVNSLSDTFDNHKSIVWHDEAFELFEQCDLVDIMLVTKRPQNIRKMVPAHWLTPGGWPAHVWVIVTVENQRAAEQRIHHLLELPGVKVRGLSVEPMVGALDLTSICTGHYFFNAFTGEMWHDAPQGVHSAKGQMAGVLSWVICGGERQLRDDCAKYAAPFHFKQWGEYVGAVGDMGVMAHCQNGQFIATDRRTVDFGEGYLGMWVGKKKAGRLLDGVEHLEFPYV